MFRFVKWCNVLSPKILLHVIPMEDFLTRNSALVWEIQAMCDHGIGTNLKLEYSNIPQNWQIYYFLPLSLFNVINCEVLKSPHVIHMGAFLTRNSNLVCGKSRNVWSCDLYQFEDETFRNPTTFSYVTFSPFMFVKLYNMYNM